MRVTGSGYLVVPAAAVGVDPPAHATAWNSGAYVQVSAGLADAVYIIGFKCVILTTIAESEIDIATGAAASEVVVGTFPLHRYVLTAVGSSHIMPVFFPYPIAVAASTRLAVRGRSSVNAVAAADDVKLIYCKQSDLVSI